MRSLIRFFTHSTWATSWGYRCRKWSASLAFNYRFYLCFVWRLGDLPRGVHAFWFPPLFLDARLPWALSLFKDWVCFGFFISLSFWSAALVSRSKIKSTHASLSFSFFSFSSVSIIHFATISVVCVVMDIFLNQGASKLFIDFCFVFAEVRNSGVFFTCACVLLLRWS